MFETFLLVFFPFLMAFAASSDLVSMTISNKVSLALIGGFMLSAVMLGMDWETIAWHWAMFGIVLGIGFVFFAFGTMGGGDVKLAASTALWFGWEHTMEYALLFSLFGGALTLIILKARGVPVPFLIQNVKWIARLYRPETGVPYGIALGAAALVVYPSTPWMEPVYEIARSL